MCKIGSVDVGRVNTSSDSLHERRHHDGNPHHWCQRVTLKRFQDFMTMIAFACVSCIGAGLLFSFVGSIIFDTGLLALGNILCLLGVIFFHSDFTATH